jgi:capsular polysaccharide biosynthesis protein
MSRVTASRWIYMVNDAVVDASVNSIYLPDRRFVADASSWPPELALLRNPCVPLWPKRLKVQTPVIVMPNSSYYHWLIEDLPAFLGALEVFPGAKALVAGRPLSYVQKALDLLNVEVLTCSGPVTTQELVFVGRTPITGWPHPRDIHELRRFGSRVERDGKAPIGVYVSRRGERRSPLNEPDVERLCADFGLSVFTAESYDFASQIAGFANARTIVGPHGAGLANQVWADEGCSIVELLDSSYVNGCYAALAATCAHRYEARIGDAAKSWSIDLHELEILLRRLLP